MTSTPDSPTPTRKRKRIAGRIIVWLLRLIVGAIFLASGLAKAIDIWGFIYKIEEYLSVWQFTQPRSLVFMAALIISGAEFLGGFMVITGICRRFSLTLLSLIMAVMLPLSLYIYIANPVSDCGCFGDMIVLSNSATFWKNVLICAMLVVLWRLNLRYRGLFTVHVQWLVIAIAVAYVLIVAIYGYFVQPMVDFRSFPVGQPLIHEESEEDHDDGDMMFIYEREGVRKSFSLDNLPDSTWTFVDRIGGETHHDSATDFAFYDSDGDEVSEEVISNEGDMMILVVPQIERAEVSWTYFLNELNSLMLSRHGKLIALVSGSADGIEIWQDLSMATYPIYSAESTLLKEMARGNMALLYLNNGIVEWKRNLAAFDTELPASMSEVDEDGNFDLPFTLTFTQVSGGALVVLLIVYLLDSTGRLVNWGLKHRKITK